MGYAPGLRSAFALFALGPAWAASSLAATGDLNWVRSEINSLERELLQGKETQTGAAAQLKKVRRLLGLQQREITLSKKKIAELGTSMDELSAQKRILLSKIEKQKISLRQRLRELGKATDREALDASWLTNLDAENQKSYFLSKSLKKNLMSVDELKRDVQEALALELKILEEKNKLDYYVHELQSQASLLGMNEDVQKEILRTNRSSRLEALRRIRALKESESELRKMIPELKAAKPVDLAFASLRGRLLFPVEGPVLSGFGKSYNTKTNLLSFQKGIVLGAPAQAQVKAVSSGRVVFAGPLKSYGLIAIVEHPGQYYTLYGQMRDVAVENGSPIRQGDVLGHTSSEPFYFEIRDKNVAINPLQWLSNSSITSTKRGS